MVKNVKQFGDSFTLAQSLAAVVASDLQSALKQRPRASLMVSGGKTPIPFLNALSAAPLDWSAVDVSLTDERWVDVDHEDSNEALVRKQLLRGLAAAARMIGLKNAAATPSEGEAECEARLSAMARPFDVATLGLGEDGHTASLFPQSPQLAAAAAMDSKRLCMGVDPVTAPYPRMTLTVPALFNSRHLIIFFVGEKKYEVYKRALEAGPTMALPVSLLLHQKNIELDVYWSF